MHAECTTVKFSRTPQKQSKSVTRLVQLFSQEANWRGVRPHRPVKFRSTPAKIRSRATLEAEGMAHGSDSYSCLALHHFQKIVDGSISLSLSLFSNFGAVQESLLSSMEARHLQVSMFTSKLQRCPATSAETVKICLCVDQHFRNFQVPVLCSNLERAPAILPTTIDVCLGLPKFARDLFMSTKLTYVGVAKPD